MKLHMRLGLVAGICVCFWLASPVFAEKTRYIEDMLGRKVALRPGVEKIVTGFKPAALCVLSLGLSDRLVAIDSHSKHDRLQLSVHPPIAELPGIGTKTTGLNLETIINHNPDLVLLYAHKDGVQIADRLTAYGIPAIIVRPETFDGVYQTLRLIAMAVGEPERAEKVVAASNHLLNLVAANVKDIPKENRKVVYYASSKGIFNTTTGNMLQDEMITRAGGTNASRSLKGYFREISPEQFIEWNPDFVAASPAGGARETDLLSSPQFQQVKAVADGNVYRFPSDMAPWDFPSPLTTLGVVWLGKRLYPERFKTLDLTGEIDKFHQILFGKSFSAMGGRLQDRMGTRAQN